MAAAVQPGCSDAHGLAAVVGLWLALSQAPRSLIYNEPIRCDCSMCCQQTQLSPAAALRMALEDGPHFRIAPWEVTGRQKTPLQKQSFGKRRSSEDAQVWTVPLCCAPGKEKFNRLPDTIKNIKYFSFLIRLQKTYHQPPPVLDFESK